MKPSPLSKKYYTTLNECTDLLQDLQMYLDENYLSFIKTPDNHKLKELERIQDLLKKAGREILKRKELQIK